MSENPKVYSWKNPIIWILSILLIFLAIGCKSEAENGEKIRIAVARFSHETCTFCPRPTTIEDWEFYGLPSRELFESNRGYIGGFKRMCDEYGGIELVGILSPRGARGGSSGSWITAEAFDKYSSLIVDDLEQAGHLDGVFLTEAYGDVNLIPHYLLWGSLGYLFNINTTTGRGQDEV